MSGACSALFSAVWGRFLNWDGRPGEAGQRVGQPGRLALTQRLGFGELKSSFPLPPGPAVEASVEVWRSVTARFYYW